MLPRLLSPLARRAALPGLLLVLAAAAAADKPEGKKPAKADGDWWSLQPLVRPVPPAVAGDWARTPIDPFILVKLREKGLEPSPPADKRTLLRRVTFDLTGLPPTPEEQAFFLADASPAAYERVVDRLLASPHYGERWARHWMDVVHFAETHGHDQDRPRPNAWPYRDYLIHSFNADKPYARFVQEQLAGDVLFSDDPDATVAMGFLAAGPWDESSLRDIREDSIDRQIARYLDRDDIVTTAVSTFLSTTVHCARCHDHKFDPIPQQDYYALQAVFAGTEKGERAYDPDPRVAARRQELSRQKTKLQADRGREPPDAALLAPALQAEVAAWERRQALARLLTAVPAALLPAAVAKALAVPGDRRTDPQKAELARHVRDQQFDRQLAALPPSHWVYAGASDFKPDASHKPVGKPRDVHLLKRGDINKPGEAVRPGALACVPGLEARFRLDDPVPEGARRTAFARWVTDPNNVLAWRSVVNRVWHHHFGRGLVDTPNDFGRMGSPPTHPELLDWLAVTFRDGGGSLKQLHRLIVTSAVYRQASRYPPRFAEIDGDNRYLWRMNRARLDAESLRDAVLVATGKLDRTMGGPSVKQFIQTPGVHVTPVVDYQNFDVDRPENRRRSVYRFLFRTLPDPFMEALDCPDGAQLTPARNASVTALQALAMLNDKFMVRQSEHLAARAAGAGPDLPAQLRAVYGLTLNRAPTPRELEALTTYATKHGLANACRVVLNSNEFLFVD